MGIAQNLLVENSGNRPVGDIQLIVLESDVKAALLSGPDSSSVPEDAELCFFSQITIPVLANGRSASNAFSHLGQTDSWRPGVEIPVTVKYRDLSGRRFSNRVGLFLADDAGFAQTFWESNGRDNG